ncbi:MAG: rod shape-determining protein MreC [Pseudomonadota bacterium]
MPLRAGKGSKKTPLRRYMYFAAVVSLIGLLFLQTSPQLKNRLDPVRTAASDQMLLLSKAGLGDDFSALTGKDRQIAELEARIRDLAPYKAMALSMAERLEVYENILNLQGEPESSEVTARAIAETDGPFAQGLLVNAGARNGINDTYFAENDRGLVGRVVSVGQRSARILKITDFNSRVPVMGEASGLRAILYGGRDQRGRLLDRPETGAFIQGERVLTSGEGGLFPRGVVVGWVSATDGAETEVQLAMTDGQLGYVRLKPSIRISPPEAFPVEMPFASDDNRDGAG